MYNICPFMAFTIVLWHLSYYWRYRVIAILANRRELRKKLNKFRGALNHEKKFLCIRACILLKPIIAYCSHWCWFLSSRETLPSQLCLAQSANRRSRSARCSWLRWHSRSTLPTCCRQTNTHHHWIGSRSPTCLCVHVNLIFIFNDPLCFVGKMSG